ncbi:MAG: hypothetical protein JNJ41_18455 [Bacteroidia bacterium]|nr:hypothetical protein [Bacteroidia bacterium]
MTERLLNRDEIESIILKSASLNIVYPKDIEPFFVGMELTSILKISKINRLIFVKGNIYTGFDHIHARHDFFSEELFFVDEKVDQPTRFSSKIVPIVDYPRVADSIYSDLNKSEKNKRPDLFDIYDGVFDSTCSLKGKYRLILYKNTRVVHTLFPIDNNKKKKKKSKTNLGRGRLQTDKNINSDTYKIAIPYFDARHKLKYLIILYNSIAERKTEFVIQSHDNKGNSRHIYKITESIYEEFPSDAHERITWQNRNLSIIERYFNKVDEYEKMHYPAP